MENKLYVAYGSNLNLKQMARRCPMAKVIGIGKLKDYQLTFNCVATIEPVKGAETPVGVWELTLDDEIALDTYEGYPQIYRKEMVRVEMQDGVIDAMVYIMNGGLPCLPSEQYYNKIYEGYEEVGLDHKYLKAALDDTQRRMKAE